jgi:FkbM family methyltransferase
MIIFNHSVYAQDFVPPIINKILKFVKGDQVPPKISRIHPFDSVPSGIEARWILDVGANYGFVTVAALKTYKNCSVICFEPVKETFKVLNENLLEYKDRVILHNLALSDKNGSGQINITNFHGANSIEQQSDFHKFLNPGVREIEKETIELRRLDDVAEKFPTNYIDILKIDVEGHELNVLKGGAKFISSSVDTIIIEIALQRDNSYEDQSVFEIFYLLHSLGFCLINCVDLHHVNDLNLMLVQMDCVFRHKSKLQLESVIHDENR